MRYVENNILYQQQGEFVRTIIYCNIILNNIIDALQRDCVLRADSAVYRRGGLRGIPSDNNLGLSCRESNVFAINSENVEYDYQRDFER